MDGLLMVASHFVIIVGTAVALMLGDSALDRILETKKRAKPCQPSTPE